VAVVKIAAIDHVQLAMPPGEEERATEFYQDVLGMEVVSKPLSLQASGGVWFKAGDAELHLGVESDFRAARKAHPALRVEDLDGFASRCEAAGYPVHWDERYPGVRRFYVNDPFGNRIELCSSSEPGGGAM
jgi:catechol 2,3-dioxygenase-like lactoylglutathione lyase family enzyme